MKKLVVGSLEGQLAVMQTEEIVAKLLSSHPDLKIERKVFQSSPIHMLTQCVGMEKETNAARLEEALQQGSVDFAVIALKDVPLDRNELLPIAAYTKREDARDCLIARNDITIESDLKGLVIGISDIRRKAQLLSLYKDILIRKLEGDLLCRIHSMERGECEAIIAGAADVKRAGFEKYSVRYFEEEELVPAAGQGILAILTRPGLEPSIFRELNQEASEVESSAERAYVRALGKDRLGAGNAYGIIKNNKLYLTGLYYKEATKRCYKESVIGYKGEAEKLGVFFANYMRRRYRT